MSAARLERCHKRIEVIARHKPIRVKVGQLIACLERRDVLVIVLAGDEAVAVEIGVADGE